MRTLKPVKGHMYSFSMVGGTLVVTEEVAGQGHQTSLELLDVGDVDTAPCEPWGAELPVRIRQLHSHWLCRDQNIIVVRPVSFLGHSTQFLICCDSGSMNSNESHHGGVERLCYSCLRIPLHLMQRPWPSLLTEHRAELTDELVLAQQSSLGLHILAKIEASKFIHTFSTSGRPIMGTSGSPMGAAGVSSARPGSFEDSACNTEAGSASHESMSLLWELPRYGLEFEHVNGIFLSRDYAGFKLADVQQLTSST
eukprot:gene27658-7296_t